MWWSVSIMLNWIPLKLKRTADYWKKWFILTLVSDWREREAKIQATFTGDADGGPLTQCLCFQCSSMFQSRLRQTGSSHSNMYCGSGHFSHRLLPQKLPLMETWRKIWSAPPGQLLRDCRCFIAAAEFTCWHSFQEWSGMTSPNIRSLAVPGTAGKDILSKMLTFLLMRYYSILKNLCPWKTKLLNFILLAVTVVQCVGGFLLIYMALTLSEL